MHRSPWWFHQFETLFNHFIELVVPFFIFLGRRMCIVHGVLQILFQVRLSWRCFPHPHPLAARSIPRGRCAGAGALRAALCRAAAHPARTGAAPRGTDSRGRSRVQVRVSQDDSELLALGLRVARTAPGALLEMCCPGLGFGFRSHGWQRNSAGLAQGLILQGPGGRGWSGSILAISPLQKLVFIDIFLCPKRFFDN